jgi:metal-responsive CopG/Arc/MetJ family transcriptional regulator
MNRKTKINVLLPIKMVGELERLSKAGKRSEFITKAIRSRLDNQDNFDLWDIDDKEILKMARVIANKNNDEVLKTILSNRLEALE